MTLRLTDDEQEALRERADAEEVRGAIELLQVTRPSGARGKRQRLPLAGIGVVHADF